MYLKKWLKKQLLNKIVSYLNKFSSELDIKYNSVFIRTQKTKWASCSSRSNLSFNIKIASLPEELIEYAVLHEAVHLKEDKHNKNFWKIVKAQYPDYKEKESLLAGFWFLIKRNGSLIRGI